MKKNTYLIILVLLSSFIFSKKDKILEDVTYNQTQDISYTKKIKNGTNFNSYLTKSGSLISLGDTLILGSPIGGGQSYNELTGSTQGVYSTIIVGNMTTQMLTGPQFLTANFMGNYIIVEKIYAYHAKMTRKSPINILAVVKDPDLAAFARRTISGMEKALEFGEIKLLNAPITRKEAIAKLKEAKDLLDLEIISQEEYDKLKAELTLIITKK